MEQVATVKSVNGKIAEIEVSRKSMCDGCHQTECASGCAMSSLFSSGKSMRASAINNIGAVPGDTVEVETSDKSVLFTALLVFVLPIIVGCIFYSAARYGAGLSGNYSSAFAVAGFILPFIFLKFIDNKQKNSAPKIVIKRIVKSHGEAAFAEFEKN